MEFERRRYGSSSSSPPASPKQSHSIGFSCCFSPSGDGEERSPSPSPSPSLLRSSSTWLRARAQELPDIVGRLGRRRRFASGDFRYDPLSYALNFDEGGGIDDDDDGARVRLGLGSRHFSAPPPPPPPPRRPEIAVGVA